MLMEKICRPSWRTQLGFSVSISAPPLPAAAVPLLRQAEAPMTKTLETENPSSGTEGRAGTGGSGAPGCRRRGGGGDLRGEAAGLGDGGEKEGGGGGGARNTAAREVGTNGGVREKGKKIESNRRIETKITNLET